MYKTTRSIGICLIATGLSACGGDSSYQPETDLSAAQLYAEACTACHGKEGEGKFGFLFTIAGSDEPTEAIVEKIKQGGQMMPAFPQISREQASALAEYVKSL